MLASLSNAQSHKGKDQPKDAQPTLGVQLITVNGYPELLVDGHPFFVHAAEFSYFRIPRDLWSDSLDRYRALGINTIDIRIPWNWHEPTEGAVDFDGHTNPRRDLRALLRMIAEKGFRFIARPGPNIGNEWRNAGLPDWLFSTPEYVKMRMDRSAGIPMNFPQIVVAANAYVPYGTQWLTAVAHELAPYNPSNTFTLTVDSSGEDKPKEKKISGPLLFLSLNDSLDLNPTNSLAPLYSGIDHKFRDALIAGGIKPGFQGSFSVSAAHLEAGFSHPGPDIDFGIAGEWFLDPHDRPQDAGPRLLDSDAETLALIAQSLRTQPNFPPLLGSFQAGWFAPADDANAPVSDPANTLLASRWLIGQGITGIEYSPLQDSLTPPGFQTEAANREFRWDAALDLNGTRQPRARAVERNARMLATWDEFLSTSHPRAEIGIMDVRGYLQSADLPLDKTQISHESSAILRQIERVTSFSEYSSELVDPELGQADSLLRDPLLILVIPPSLRGKTFISEKAQNALLDYVRRGGTLVCQPERPAGAAFDQAFGGATPENVGEGLRVTKLGEGKLVEMASDIFSWADLNESFAANLARPESAAAAKQLQAVIKAAGGLAPIVSLKDHPSTLLVSELVANSSAGALGSPAANCDKHPRCGEGLVSVTSWSSDDPVQDTLAIVPPGLGVRAPKEGDLISLPIEIPPRESLLLPVNIPLCSAHGPEDSEVDSCNDKVVAAGAEFLDATRNGKTLDLIFYAPAKATVIVKLESAPTSVELPVQILINPNDRPIFPERTLEGHFEKGSHIFTVEIPRGAAPDFVRDLRLHLDYTPSVPERPKPPKHHAHDFRYSVADAVRLPLGRGSLATDPPLVPLDTDGNGRLVVHAVSQSDDWITVQAVVDGAAHGSERLHLDDHEEQFLVVKLLATGAGNSPPDPKTIVLQPGTLNLTGDHKNDRKSPLTFLMASGDDPVGYEYDFERSGSKNWVLENKNMRLILLPDAGGEIAALVDKATDANLTTTVGGLRDLLRLPDGTLIDPTFNLAYQPRWGIVGSHPAISLEAALPEGAPISGGIEKHVHLETKDGKETVEVHYKFIPKTSGKDPKPTATVVTAFSVPAGAGAPDHTQFCWFASTLPENAAPNSLAGSALANPAVNPATNPSANAAGNPGANPAAGAVDAGHCSPFVAGGGAISLPAEAKRVEVRTVSQPTLVMEWDSGRAAIEQKQFSARLLLEFPGGGAMDANSGNNGGVRVRYTILHAP
ncbi:MAG: beta-galactosidase [Candidatus Acidiferrales bacterium]